MQEHQTINIPSEDEVLSAHEQLDVAPLIPENAAALALKNAENGGHLADDLRSEPGSTKLEIIENNNSDRLAFEDIMNKMRIFVFSVFFPQQKYIAEVTAFFQFNSPSSYLPSNAPGIVAHPVPEPRSGGFVFDIREEYLPVDAETLSQLLAGCSLKSNRLGGLRRM
ncbi:Wilt-inducing protein [Fusarium oxysporum f. sp. albedinis]|nr:Wilt-inducing protein [Fusarium oxysporum f. sp. albedinis]